MSHPLPLPYEPCAGNRAIVQAALADMFLAPVKLIAQALKASNGLPFEPAQGEFLYPVGKPALKELAVELRGWLME